MSGLLAALLIAGFVTLLNAPWLRVTSVAWSGEQFTPSAAVAAELDALRGESLLTIDRRALAERLAALPAVADVEVELRLPDLLRVEIEEKAPALIWQTSTSRLVATSDGSVIAELARDAELPAGMAELPFFDDAREASRRMAVGDVIPPETIRLAIQLDAIEPARLGSAASDLTVRIDDEFGFVLVSSDPPWQAAFGFYGLDPSERASVAERIERQAAAVRTLFAQQTEVGVAWLDARNPMKVYFRATDG